MATEILSGSRYRASTISHTALTTAGLFYVINSLVRLAMNSAAANAPNVFAEQADLLRVPKATGEAWADGDPLYLKADLSAFTKTAASNHFAGWARNDQDGTTALSADTEGLMELSAAAQQALALAIAADA